MKIKSQSTNGLSYTRNFNLQISAFNALKIANIFQYLRMRFANKISHIHATSTQEHGRRK